MSIIVNGVLIIIMNSANITSFLICANSHYAAITQKFYWNIRFNKLMQSFTFFVPFNSSFWNCSYGSVSQLFYLLFIKFIEKRKKTTPLHDKFYRSDFTFILFTMHYEHSSSVVRISFISSFV